jgi:hypothetical protein
MLDFRLSLTMPKLLLKKEGHTTGEGNSSVGWKLARLANRQAGSAKSGSQSSNLPCRSSRA